MATEQQLQYTAEHEWVETDGDVVTVGITAYAAGQLGDIVFVELPEVGSAVIAGQVIGELESTKSVGELFSPVTGTITAVNDELSSTPEAVNGDPYGAGWLLKVQVAELPPLLDHAAYLQLTGAA